jgi:hypothetical protein
MGRHPTGFDIGVGSRFGEAVGFVIDGVEEGGFGLGHS